MTCVAALGQSACGGEGASSGPGGAGTGTGASSTGGAGGGGGGEVLVGSSSGSSGTGGSTQDFQVEPSAPQTITVIAGQAVPTLDYEATLNGTAVSAGWSVDRGEVGKVMAGPSSETTFTPTGTTGGLVKVLAGLNGEVVERRVFVKIVSEQNGADPSNPAEQPQIATTVPALKEGGGIGGVGGEGLGVAVADPNVVTALATPVGDGSAQELALLYPYDATVWPRGMLAPLLMWDWSVGDADAIQIELSTTSGSFSWKGTFGPPPILAQTGGAFVRHPIPQHVWAAATNTAGGQTLDDTVDRLIVKLTVAKDGQAYGPIAQTWTIAPARLTGTIFYNSYGTQLAKNYGGAVGGDGQFGGAVLSIRAGDAAPKLVAGGDGNSTQCRVCHSVASGGSRLVVQHGNNYAVSSRYDITPLGADELMLATGATFPAVSPNGALALGPTGQLIDLTNGGATLPVAGLSATATNLGTPAFAPNGALVVFNPMASSTIANPTQKLVVMGFDAATGTFSNAVVVSDDTGSPAATRPGWPAFFPDAKSVVFHRQTAAGADGNGHGDLHTRKGSKAHLAWTSVTSPADVTPLDMLNGRDAMGQVYLPKLKQPLAMGCTGDGVQVGGIDADHGDDVNLNYEPTVSPVASGGYAWVVFMSRRMYGNVATIPPFCSDPRGVDLVENITTKKLWVAAIDLDAKPGKDSSHPGFYLPAQELIAGNARGFWVFDPCKPDGETCETGDQCCNGFCAPSGEDGLVCSDTPPNGECSMVQEKCSVAADCCDGKNVCVNGFCALPAPK